MEPVVKANPRFKPEGKRAATSTKTPGLKGRQLARFQQERTRLNELVTKYAGRGIKRFYSIDAQVYQPGALPAKTKEMLGLVASVVLRCDDCIKYHLINCHQQRVTSAELDEALAIAMTVGGSITIPHIRRAFEAWDELSGNRG